MKVTAAADLESFLERDLHDALKGMFVGAVTWQAHPDSADPKYLRGLGMFTTFVQARALYEFFYPKGNSAPEIGGTASAKHIAPMWNATDVDSLFSTYMADRASAQKRVFHLVYGRSGYSGGAALDESDHLKNQVLRFAVDIRRLTEELARVASPPHGALIQAALQDALGVARQLAARYGLSLRELA